MSGTIPLTSPVFKKPVSKIDLHTHLRKKPGHNVFTPEERIAFNKVMDISHSVILSVAKPSENPKEFDPSADPRIFAEDAAKICNEYKESFSWFCNILPDGTSETYKKLEHYKKLGAVGVGEVDLPIRFDDPRMDHMLDCCQSLELPILTHMNPFMSNKGIVDEVGMPLLEKALKKYPKLKYIGHSQPFWLEISTYSSDLTPEQRNVCPSGKVIPGRVVELLTNYENLYGDLSANSGGNAILRDADFGIEFLEKFQDKLIYGTDTLSANIHYPLGAYLDSLYMQKKISFDAYAKICRNNTLKLLNLEL